LSVFMRKVLLMFNALINVAKLSMFKEF